MKVRLPFRSRKVVSSLVITACLSALLAILAGFATNLVSNLVDPAWLSANRATVVLILILLALLSVGVAALSALNQPGHRRSTYLTQGEQLSPTPSARFWNVPRSPTRVFVGRSNELSYLQAFSSDLTPRMLALTGMGGVGKTQLVVQHLYGEREAYRTGVWWVVGKEVKSGLAVLAQRLGLIEEEVDETEAAIAGVRWLEAHEDWLLVLDDVEDYRDIELILPHSPSSKVLITSRSQHWTSDIEVLPIEVLAPRDAAKLLTLMAGEDSSDQVNELAHLLGNLPLALEQAGAYIRSERVSFRHYIGEYNRRRTRLLESREPTVSHDTVTATVQLSVKRLRRRSRVAVAVLDACAYLAAEDIPRRLLDKLASAGIKDGTKASTTNYMSALLEYSLVRATPDLVSLHPLTQEVLRASHSGRVKRRLVKWVLDLVVEPSSLDMVGEEALAPHIRAAATYASDVGYRSPRAAQVLGRMGMAAYASGDADAAEKSALIALSHIVDPIAHEEGMGEISIGQTLVAARRFKEAQEFMTGLIDRLSSSEQHGAAGFMTGYAWSVLAQATAGLGEREEAHAALRRANLIVMGNRDTEMTSLILVSLARASLFLDEFTEASQFAERAIEVVKQTKGSDNLDMFSALAVYGEALSYAGQHDQALETLDRAQELLMKYKSPEERSDDPWRWVSAAAIVKASKEGIPADRIDASWDVLKRTYPMFGLNG